MITIITGSRDAGKTRALREHYAREGRGDGFASVKVYAGGMLIGYDCVRLSTGERVPLAYRTASLPPGTVNAYTHGSFTFLRGGLDFAAAVIGEILEARVEPVFLDEIGKLELSGQGFDAVLRRVTSEGLDLVIAVRDINVDAVIERYRLSGCEIFRS